MDQKIFCPAVEPLDDIPWTMTRKSLDDENHMGDEEENKEHSVTKNGGHKLNLGRQACDVTTEVKNSKVSDSIDLAGANANLMDIEKCLETTDGRQLQKSLDITEGKLSKNTSEMKPGEKIKVLEVKLSTKTKEVIEVKPAKEVIKVEQKVEPSQKTIYLFQIKPAKTSGNEVIQDKPFQFPKNNSDIPDVESSKKTDEHFTCKVSDEKGSKRSVDCAENSENQKASKKKLESIEDMFKKYISEEYLDFLDGSLSLDNCHDEKNPLSSQDLSGQQNDLSFEVQKIFHSSSSSEVAENSNSASSVQNDSEKLSENETSSVPSSSVQSCEEALVLLGDENVSGDFKRYSLRKRKSKSFKMYYDTDKWVEDQLDFMEEKVPYQLHTKQIKKHPTDEKLRKTEDSYRQSVTGNQNVQSFVEKCDSESKNEQLKAYKYVPRKPRSIQQTYMCMACHMDFKSEGDLELHRSLNVCYDMYRCVVCGDIFSSVENLCIHGAIHNVFFCSVCGRCYKTKTGLLRHQYDHTGYKPYSCSKCLSSYKTKNELAIHNVYHTGEMSFYCHVCSKGFPTIGQMKRHVTMHDTMDTDKEVDAILKASKTLDKTCANSLNSQELLQSRRKVHQDKAGSPEFVNDCQRNGSENHSQEKLDVSKTENEKLQPPFNYPSASEELDDNMQSQGSVAINADESNRNFQSRQSEEYQQKKEQGSVKSTFPIKKQSNEGEKKEPCEKISYCCSQCSKEFGSHMAYLYHKLIHNRDSVKKSHKCYKCPMVFYLESSLTSHQLIHKEPVKTVCETCGETFGNQLALVYHRAIHSYEKSSLKCSKCSKVFETMKQLDRHKETHSMNRKLFPCLTCGRTFQTRSGLARHIMDHTGERRYSCTVCEKKFKTNTQLRCHFSIHTGIRPYSCEICGKSFAIKSYLTAHLMGHK
ncbi:zinc finger protein 665-like [Argopecten irradians]|uniref:zinc finger protein 665-like n=1 Tax=Argopecten irradians TaxID=31199 RepID=UPI00371B740B